MENDAVDAHAVVVVEQFLEHRRMFVPCASYLGESLCLDDVLAIDMRSAHSVEHIVELVVRGTVQPEFTHGVIGKLIVAQSVAYHRRCHTFRRELHAVLVGKLSHFREEHVVHEVADAQYLLRLFRRTHRNSRIYEQPWLEVVAATLLEFVHERAAPVLRTSLPTVHVQSLQHPLRHILRGMAVDGGKPVVKLLPHCLHTELVTFQSSSSASCGVGVSGGCMSYAHDVPSALRQVEAEWGALCR